jgi:hypothetical protein
MKPKQKFSVILLVIFSLMVLEVNGHPYINHNGAGGGYGGSAEAYSYGLSIQALDNNSIEYYIMKAGTYYLEANSHIQSLLKLVEQQELYGIDYFRMQLEVYFALNNMKQAKENYRLLIDTAESTPYNEVFLAKLRDFDYDAFEQANEFNAILFSLVRRHLQNGDITGLFKVTYADIIGMIEKLTIIRDSVNQFCLPDISVFRHLNENQALSSIFGSYAACIFQQINQT